MDFQKARGQSVSCSLSGYRLGSQRQCLRHSCVFLNSDDAELAAALSVIGLFQT